jgi:hypothetical protein
VGDVVRLHENLKWFKVGAWNGKDFAGLADKEVSLMEISSQPWFKFGY